ncbi:MAG: VCBS repeat-containing protein [Armatimonadetes bacterium]|nr:VCBS repeat-containing protein [Armatimonadota bacterium]
MGHIPLFLLSLAVNPAILAAIAFAPGHPAPIPFEHIVIDRDTPEGTDCKAAGDIDGDGFPDILLGGNLKGGNLVWYRHPDWKKHVIDTGQFSVDMQVGDVDGDGDLDVVISEAYEAPSKGKALVWYENPRPKGNPATDPWKRHVITASAPVDSYIHDVEVGDINSDGKLDVAIRHGKTALYIQNSPDSWTEKVLDAGSGAGDEEGTALADLNRDGRLDVVLNGYWLEQPSDPIKGTWVKHMIAPDWPHLVGVTVADINGDRRPDVLLSPAEDPGRLSWYEAPTDPASGKWIEHVIDEDVHYIHTFKVADMNLDGKLDVVTAEMAESGYHPDKPSRKRLCIYLNGGRGLKWRRQVVAVTGLHNLRLADIGSDGDIDIIGANWGGSYHPVKLWRNRLDPKKR